MQTSEFYAGGFEKDGFDFSIMKKVIFNGFNPKTVIFTADIVRFDELLERRTFKTKQGAMRFLEKWHDKRRELFPNLENQN